VAAASWVMAAHPSLRPAPMTGTAVCGRPLLALASRADRAVGTILTGLVGRLGREPAGANAGGGGLDVLHHTLD